MRINQRWGFNTPTPTRGERECAGAVTLLPEGVAHPTLGETQTRELSKSQLQDIMLELKQAELP